MRAAAVRDPAARRRPGRARRRRRRPGCGSATGCAIGARTSRRRAPAARGGSARSRRAGSRPALRRGRAARRAAQLGRPARGRRAAGGRRGAHRGGARRAHAHLRGRSRRAARRRRRRASTSSPARRSARPRPARGRSPPACGRASSTATSRCGRAAARTCSCRPGGSATRARRSTCPCPGERGRWVFALPRTDGLVAIGLTDVAGRRRRSRTSRVPSAEEEAELLAHASAALEVYARPGGRRRPLRRAARRCWPASGRDRATSRRRHTVRRGPGPACSRVVGGKLTTYRAMAQDVVDRLTDAARAATAAAAARSAPPRRARAAGAAARLVRRGTAREAPAGGRARATAGHELRTRCAAQACPGAARELVRRAAPRARACSAGRPRGRRRPAAGRRCAARAP